LLKSRLSRGQCPLVLAAVGLLLLSACTAGGNTATDGSPPTEGAVEAAWRAAEQCLRADGYDASAEQTDLSGRAQWGVSLGGDVEETQAFLGLYDTCVAEAERLNLAFDRARLPEGAEQVELAASFDRCIANAEIEPLTYDRANPDEVSALADATSKLGYAQDDETVGDDPRFETVLGCFQAHELLFPGRFEANDS